MACFQAVILGLTSLILLPGYSFYFDVTPKLVVFWIGTAVLLVWSTLQFRPAPRPFSAVLLLSLIPLGLSAAASPHPALSVFGTTWRRFGAISQAALLLFSWTIAAQTAGRPDRIRMILRGIAVSGAIAALYGIFQYAGWDPLLDPARYHIGEGLWTIVRPPGTFGYVSYFANWLVAVIFLCIALASAESSRWWRGFALAAAAVSAAAMVLTGTRAALAGLFAGLAAGFYLQRNVRLSGRHAAIIFAALFAAIAFWRSPAGWLLHSRLRWFTEDPWGGARPLLWRDSWVMALHHPWLGCGLETFQSAFPHYESAALARAYPDFAHESSHNIFLDAFTAEGLPGVLALILLCLVGLRRSQPWFTAAIIATATCQQFIVFNLPTALLFNTTIALAVSKEAAEPKSRRAGSHVLIAATLLAVGLLVLALRFEAADRQLALTQQALHAQNFPAAEHHYRNYERLQPGPTTADLWYSRALLDTASHAANPATRIPLLARSATLALRATKTAEDPFNAWFQLAILCASQDNRPATESSLRSAIAAHPLWFKPHWTLARLLLQESRRVEAEREASLAVDLDGGKHSEVLQTLTLIRGLPLSEFHK